MNQTRGDKEVRKLSGFRLEIHRRAPCASSAEESPSKYSVIIALRLQMTQSKSYLHTLGLEVGTAELKGLEPQEASAARS